MAAAIVCFKAIKNLVSPSNIRREAAARPSSAPFDSALASGLRLDHSYGN